MFETVTEYEVIGHLDFDIECEACEARAEVFATLKCCDETHVSCEGCVRVVAHQLRRAMLHEPCQTVVDIRHLVTVPIPKGGGS